VEIHAKETWITQRNGSSWSRRTCSRTHPASGRRSWLIAAFNTDLPTDTMTYMIASRKATPP
jgi:hypothetical protein